MEAMANLSMANQGLRIRQWLWIKRFERLYSSHAGLLGDGQQLHFLFGVGEGGADHLGQLLVQAGVPIRYYANLLPRVLPSLVLSASGEPTAIPYEKDLDDGHPLVRVHRMLVEYDNEWATSRMHPPAQVPNPETLPCLVKSHQALLATEALLRRFGCRALLYVGDPVKILDRMFAQGGLDTPYLKTEGRSLFSPTFLGRFLRRDYRPVLDTYYEIRRQTSGRARIIRQRLLTVALLQHMFRMLAARYPQQAILVDYAVLRDHPHQIYTLLERLFGDVGLDYAEALITSATFQAQGDRQLLWKDSWPDFLSWSGFLSADEIRDAYRLLEKSGLGTNPTLNPRERWTLSQRA